MSKTLKFAHNVTQNGVSIEVEVPGYGKHDVTVELKPKTFDFHHKIVDRRWFLITANNKTRGLSELLISISGFDNCKVDDIKAEVVDGILYLDFKYNEDSQGKLIKVN